MPAPPAIDSSRCPLCGERNGCAVEAALSRSSSNGCGGGGNPNSAPTPTDCWCMQLDAASFDSTLLARLPPAARGTACICARCCIGCTSVSSHSYGGSGSPSDSDSNSSDEAAGAPLVTPHTQE